MGTSGSIQDPTCSRGGLCTLGWILMDWAGRSGHPWEGRTYGGGQWAGQLLAIPGGQCCNGLGQVAQAEMLT